MKNKLLRGKVFYDIKEFTEVVDKAVLFIIPQTSHEHHMMTS